MGTVFGDVTRGFVCPSVCLPVSVTLNDPIYFNLLRPPFTATQLSSTRRRVELSCVAIDTLTDATQLSPTVADDGRRF